MFTYLALSVEFVFLMLIARERVDPVTRLDVAGVDRFGIFPADAGFTPGFSRA
jgi:hypothetical protein